MKSLFFSFILSCMTYGTISQSTLSLRYEINEEQPIGSVIADDVITQLSLRHGYSAEISRTFTLSAVDGWTNLVGFVEHRRNVLVVKGRIDRELICYSAAVPSSGKDCLISVDVAVHPASYFQIIRIEILVHDINDNSPVFPHAEITRIIPESASPGTSILLPSAMDADLSPYSILGYEILSSNPSNHPFKLVYNVTNIQQNQEVRLELLRPLNREFESNYRIVISAYDGDRPSTRKSTTMQVLVQVSDVNDNSPVFDQHSYEATLSNIHLSGSAIIRLVARDADAGHNGDIRYSFSRQTLAAFEKLFSIDAVTGEIRIVRRFDTQLLQKQNEHKLQVIATDQGESSLSTSVDVTIRVPESLMGKSFQTFERHPSNDERSLIINVETVDGSSDSIHIMENNPSGTFLAHITVNTHSIGSSQDEEDDDDEYISCSLSAVKCISGSPLSSISFTLQNFHTRRDFKLLASASFDRERCSLYDVTISCETSSLTSSINIKVIIDDLDDNPSVFDREVYEVDVMENNKVGDLLLTVRAFDADVNLESSRKYRRSVVDVQKLLAANDKVSENIKNHSGHADKNKNDDSILLNNEKLSTTNLSPDSGRNKRNRNSFAKTSNIAELVYQLDDEANKFFRINPRSGEIFARISFDRESQSRYEFYVYAFTTYNSQNNGFKNQSSTISNRKPTLTNSTRLDNKTARCLVRVSILDADDEKAKFSSSWYRFNISESAGTGSEVGVVRAVDLDLPHNSMFHYRLTLSDGSESQHFAVDPNSGIIYTRQQLDREKVSHFTLKVSAVTSLSISGQSDDSSVVFIRVLDSNDNAPVFQFPSPDGTSVWRLAAGVSRDAVVLSARDQDEGNNARITYHLISGSNEFNQFHIEETTGVLTWNDLTASHHSQMASTRRKYSTDIPALPPSSIPTPSCPITLRALVRDHPDSEPYLSSDGVLFVVPRGCHWNPIGSYNMAADKSFQTSSEDSLPQFYIFLIAGVLGGCLILSLIITLSVCLCRRRHPKSFPKSSDDHLSQIPQDEGRASERLRRREKESELDSEEGEAFLMLDKVDQSGKEDARGAIVLYVKDPTGLRDPEPVARFQIHPLPEAGSSVLYSSRRGRRAESDESGLYMPRHDRDTDSGYIDVASV